SLSARARMVALHRRQSAPSDAGIHRDTLEAPRRPHLVALVAHSEWWLNRLMSSRAFCIRPGIIGQSGPRSLFAANVPEHTRAAVARRQHGNIAPAACPHRLAKMGADGKCPTHRHRHTRSLFSTSLDHARPPPPPRLPLHSPPVW